MMIGQGIVIPVGKPIDFASVTAKEYSGTHALSQKLLETSVRIADIEGIKLALQNGAVPDARFIDEAILNWKKNNDNVSEFVRNGLFVNKKFLPIVTLLRSSLSGVSCQGIECLNEAFFDAFISGRYAEVCSAEQSETYTSTRIMINTIDFSDSEYSMVENLFDAIHGIYIERMCQCWVDGPKQPAKLSIERFSIQLSPCINCVWPCVHCCRVTLSDGKEVRKELNGREIICLVKSVPHFKHHHFERIDGVDEECNESEILYAHFGEYDSFDVSPQYVEHELGELVGEDVQVGTNEGYFDLLRQRTLNDREKYSIEYIQRTLIQEMFVNCCEKAVDGKSDSLEETENRLLRAFWVLHLKAYSSSGSVSILSQMGDITQSIRSKIKIILRERNSEVDIEDKAALNAYLEKRRDEVMKGLPAFQFGKEFFYALKDYEKAMIEYLA